MVWEPRPQQPDMMGGRRPGVGQHERESSRAVAQVYVPGGALSTCAWSRPHRCPVPDMPRLGSDSSRDAPLHACSSLLTYPLQFRSVLKPRDSASSFYFRALDLQAAFHSHPRPFPPPPGRPQGCTPL